MNLHILILRLHFVHLASQNPWGPSGEMDLGDWVEVVDGSRDQVEVVGGSQGQEVVEGVVKGKATVWS